MPFSSPLVSADLGRSASFRSVVRQSSQRLICGAASPRAPSARAVLSARDGNPQAIGNENSVAGNLRAVVLPSPRNVVQPASQPAQGPIANSLHLLPPPSTRVAATSGHLAALDVPAPFPRDRMATTDADCNCRVVGGCRKCRVTRPRTCDPEKLSDSRGPIPLLH